MFVWTREIGGVASVFRQQQRRVVLGLPSTPYVTAAQEWGLGRMIGTRRERRLGNGEAKTGSPVIQFFLLIFWRLNCC